MHENEYGNPIWFVKKPRWISRTASAQASALFDALAHRAVTNVDDECWPGKWTLAIELNVDPRTVTNLLFELEYVGAVRVWPESTPRGRRNRYFLVVDSEPCAESERTYQRRKAWQKLEARLLEQQRAAADNLVWLEACRDAEAAGWRLTRKEWNSGSARIAGNRSSDGVGNVSSGRVGNPGSVEQEPVEQEPPERDVREDRHLLAENLVLPEPEFPTPLEEPEFLSRQVEEVEF